MSNPTHAGKKSLPLSLIGKVIHAVFTCGLLALLVWMLLLLLATVITITQGPDATSMFFEKALFGMTAQLWAAQSDNQCLSIFLLVTQFVTERCQVFLMGLIVIFAFSLLGFVDGLVQRDIRKFQNARESTLFFHRSKSLCVGVFFVSYFLFILIPINIPLTVSLILMAVVLSILYQRATKSFKKHL